MIKYQVSASLLSNGHDFKIERRNHSAQRKARCTLVAPKDRCGHGRGRGQPFDVEVQHAVDPCCTVLHVCTHVRCDTIPHPRPRTYVPWKLEPGGGLGPKRACLPATKFFSSLSPKWPPRRSSTCDGWTFLDQLRSGQSSKNPHRASGRGPRL